MIRCLIVDDHQLFRLGVANILNNTSDISVVGSAASGEEAMRLVRELKPDVVLMDIVMPGMGGLDRTSSPDRETHCLPLAAVPCC